MDNTNNVRYYLLQKTLAYLVEKGAITEDEARTTSRNNAEILHPDREYIR